MRNATIFQAADDVGAGMGEGEVEPVDVARHGLDLPEQLTLGIVDAETMIHVTGCHLELEELVRREARRHAETELMCRDVHLECRPSRRRNDPWIRQRSKGDAKRTDDQQEQNTEPEKEGDG